MDRFLAHFPADLLLQPEHQVWARLDADGLVTVGITDLGIQLSGEIYMCRPKVVGSAVAQGRSIAVVELAKSIVSVKSPLSGVVEAVNPLLATAPEQVHQDPYGQGWLARLRPSAWERERTMLLAGESAWAGMVAQARLHRITLVAKDG
jgi:glycine cleavage system H protein